jgi:hypothetical protein
MPLSLSPDSRRAYPGQRPCNIGRALTKEHWNPERSAISGEGVRVVRENSADQKGGHRQPAPRSIGTQTEPSRWATETSACCGGLEAAHLPSPVRIRKGVSAKTRWNHGLLSACARVRACSLRSGRKNGVELPSPFPVARLIECFEARTLSEI